MRLTVTRQVLLVVAGAAMLCLTGASTTTNHHHQLRTNSNNKLTLSNTDFQRQLQAATTSSTGWNLSGQVNGAAVGDQAGSSVSMSRNGLRVAVAAMEFDGTAGADAGHVRVFDYAEASATWSQVGQSIEGEAGAGLGKSISLSGDGTRLAIGSFNTFPYTGMVRLYQYNANTNNWDKLGQDITGVSERDRFGTSVSLNKDGSRVAIGAPFHDGNDSIRGHVRVFDLDGATWVQAGRDLDGIDEGDKMGTSVALSDDGTIVAIGAPTANGNGRNSGEVLVYQKASSLDDWTPLGSPIPGSTENDQSGLAVALSGDGMTVVIGSPMHTKPATGTATAIEQAGEARVFQYLNDAWTQVGLTVEAPVPAYRQYFGKSVAISENGLIMAVGAPYDTQTGSVAVYQNALGSWTFAGNITGTAISDRFGSSIAMSALGTEIIAGAPYADTAAGADSGLAQVYNFTSTAAGWSFDIDGLETNFGSGDQPELVLTMSGTAPTAAAGRTWTAEVKPPGCLEFGTVDSSIALVATSGDLPNAATFEIVPQLNVDPATIKDSATFFASRGVGQGQIAVCVEVLVKEGANTMATKQADMTIELDMSQDFEVDSFETVRSPTRVEVRDQSFFAYGMETFFCDEFLTNIGDIGETRPVAPGEEVSVCITNPNQDTEGTGVVDLTSVSFENNKAPLLGVPLVDETGFVLSDTSEKTCRDGKCRIAAITVPRLYEYADEDGFIIDVTDGVYMKGTAIYDFVARRRRLMNDRDLQDIPAPSSGKAKATFSIKVNLATPPDRTAGASDAASFSSHGSIMMWATSVVAFLTVFLWN